MRSKLLSKYPSSSSLRGPRLTVLVQQYRMLPVIKQYWRMCSQAFPPVEVKERLGQDNRTKTHQDFSPMRGPAPGKSTQLHSFSSASCHTICAASEAQPEASMPKNEPPKKDTPDAVRSHHWSSRRPKSLRVGKLRLVRRCCRVNLAAQRSAARKGRPLQAPVAAIGKVPPLPLQNFWCFGLPQTELWRDIQPCFAMPAAPRQTRWMP